MKPLQVREMREDHGTMQLLWGGICLTAIGILRLVASQAEVQTVGYELPPVDLLLLALVIMACVSRVNAYAIA
jgi:hypothetical protein